MTLTVRRVERSPGVSANPFFLYSWHTYQWAVWAPPADFSAEVWTDFTVSLGEVDPVSGLAMLLATVEVNLPGVVSVVWGRRSEAYGGETGPVGMQAGVPQTIECFSVEPNQTYFVNCKWSGVINLPSGVPFARTVQFGELVGSMT